MPLDHAAHGRARLEGKALRIVIRTSDAALWDLLSGDANGPGGYHEFLVDEQLGTVPVA